MTKQESKKLMDAMAFQYVFTPAPIGDAKRRTAEDFYNDILSGK